MKEIIRYARQILKRNTKRKSFINYVSTCPISDVFGYDRGTPVDRYYIENFLYDHKHLIRGIVLEIEESLYSKKYGSNVDSYAIFSCNSNKNATIVGDLTDIDSLPENIIDCFICTQTLNFIYDYKRAIAGIYKMMKKGGCVLVTVSGLSQISRYDMDRWGDYWRFTNSSINKAFFDSFGKHNVSCQTYGNVYSSIALLEGFCVEELDKDKLNFRDENYQVTIALVARKI